MPTSARSEHLEAALRSIGEGVIVADADGRITLISKLAEQLTARRQTDAVGRALADVFPIAHEVTREPRANPLEQALKTGQTVDLPENTVLVSANGTARPIAGSAAPVRDTEGRLIGGIVAFRDMTGKRKMDEAMLRASKLDSLTLLAGGIGHDFNNILTALMGNISLARRLSHAGDGLYKRLAEAEKACVQAKGLTQQLLTFAKGGAPVRTTSSLAELLEGCVSFVLRGSAVRSNLSVPDALWPVDADAGQISQVLSNLIINAEAAMPNGGTVTVCAENVAVGAEDVPPLSPGAYVHVRITDEGTGIQPAHLPLVFDPYFTTKPKGSGLGLATAQSIVRQHDGAITVESEVGVGTTFELYLPASKARVSATEEGGNDAQAGRGRVLVMDDEEMIRELAGDMLGHLGYDVSFASNGAEAIELYAEAMASGQPFDALVMDLTIPGAMGGREAIKRLREVDPGVRAVVSSGYSTDPIMTDFGQHGFSACIAKPYRLEELGEALRRAFVGRGE